MQLLPLPGTLTIKVERTSQYKTLVGIDESDNEYKEVELQQADSIIELANGLECHTFFNFKLKSENTENATQSISFSC